MGPKTKDKAKDKAPDKPADKPKEKTTDKKDLGLFGGWTGKTPVTLLNEYVQRQQSEGWHRADYNIHGTAQHGYTCVIRLSKQDKKLGLLKVEYRPTPTTSTGLRFPTAIEARHMAATYTLYQLRANTSLHRMIPPVHRTYWLELDENRKGDRVCEDPFAAKLARDRDREDRERIRMKREETKIRAKETGRTEDLLSTGLRKRWDDLAQVHMSEEQRSNAESVVRLWTATWGLKTEGNAVLTGFRPQHIEEALAACGGDQARAFEWLCVHVPEDDLPEHVMRRGYQASMVTGSNASGSELALQLAAKRLARSGFALSMCRAALEEANSEDLTRAESRAAEILVSRLCNRPVPELVTGDNSVDDEIDALDSIYAGENRITRPSLFQITVAIRPNDQVLCPSDACLEFWIPIDSSYPDSRPPSVTLSSDLLPAYLKLHITKMIDQRLARDGMPVLFDVVSIADDNIEQWLSSPPPLADLMRGIALESVPQKRSVSKHNRREHGPSDWNRTVDSFTRTVGTSAYRLMQKTRALLPAATVANTLVELIGAHRCVVVSGATGCGKTTQVPQFILDHGIQTNSPTNIICTQPRRISAVGVAGRVAEERVSVLGDTIGYAVRGESKKSNDTRLLFCTTGVLLRMIGTDPSLTHVTHVVCDEVHERSVDSDLLLVLLLQSMRLNPRLHVVLMSATAQSDLFAEYFGHNSPVVDIPGRTFPVDDVYIEDFVSAKSEAELVPVFGSGWADSARRRWDSVTDKDDSGDWIARAQSLMSTTQGDRVWASALVSWEDRYASPSNIDYALATLIVRHIHMTSDHGLAILVFMPGVAEIQSTIAALKAIDGLSVLPLHSGLSAAEQRRVFAKSPSGRKVIVATNIAETSITIDDIGFVIDSGRVRELRHDHGTRVAKLTTVLCSQAAAAQRRGRAGRTRPGVCYRMYTRRIHGTMPMYGDPEILRSPLEQVCLRVKALGHQDPRTILASALDPPPLSAVSAAEHLLVAVGATVEEFGALTALGKFIADIPVDLRLAKILVYGALMGVLDDALKIVALMALDKPLFHDKLARKKFANDSLQSGLSDWLADLAAFNQLDSGGKAYDLGCSPTAIRDVRGTVRQLRDSLRHTGLVEQSSKASPMVLKALICAGLSPNIVRVRMPQQKFTEVIGGTISKDHEARQVSFYAPDIMSLPGSGPLWQSHDYRTDRRVFIHPQSTLFSATKYQATPFIVYFAQSTSSLNPRTYLRDATVPGLYALLMFGPAPLIIDHENKVLCIGSSGALAVRAWPRIAVLVNQLRILLDELLRRKLEAPESVALADHPVVTTVLQLLETDGQ
ncbi:putative ATP-dependent RNA helicase ucp12 [Coemansia sp. RSA 922]|nr:putative ATP-dependent RNA helicase ucp12 [Coemansia sp. RSA 922]